VEASRTPPRSAESWFALEQLLVGPSARERAEGLTSAIPTGAKIRSLSIVQRPKGSTATVDLAGLPPLANVNGTMIARIGTEIARTLIGLSDVARVRIESNGRPWNFWLMHGGNREQGRRDSNPRPTVLETHALSLNHAACGPRAPGKSPVAPD